MPAILALSFFLSGATGLVYEVVWLRMLGLVFGHTVYAITTVLAAFMAGLGLGSLVFGRVAARIRDPIRAYGLLEIGVGLSCALVPLLLWLASFVYVGLHSLLATSYAAFSFVQFLVVFALLLVPTTLMGGTLPILSQALAHRPEGIGRIVGTLYAVNTFGAVLGVAAAGYGLLPVLGNRATVAIAVVGNLAVGALAITYSRRVRRAGSEAVEPAAPRPSAPPAPPAPRDLGARLTVLALGVSGAISMIYEVAWTRALALVIGSSTYAFTAMLVAFLLGIAGGAAVYTVLWGRRPATPALFAGLQAGIGLLAALTILLFERLPLLFLLSIRRSDSPSYVELVQFVVSAHVLLPSALLIGATFPCAVAIWARAPERTGADVGRLYAVNTAGAIVGAVLAGFALIPALGVHTSLKVAVALNLALAAALAVVSRRPVAAWRWGAAGAALAAAAGVLVLRPWDPAVMSSGMAVYAKEYLAEWDQGIYEPLHGGQVIFYRDGPTATVTVTKSGDSLGLRVNGKVDASINTGDMPTQVMLGHLGLLIHPDARAVLVVGLGSGITAGAVAQHPVERLDVVEIEPAVVEAERFFASANGDVLKDRRVRVVIADARNFLITTKERYDVIISEPSNPWMSGVATLFTREFFRLARHRLRADGLMVQWVHAYSLLPEDFHMIVRTFREAFPATSIWHMGGGDFLLVGRTAPLPIDVTLLRTRYEASAAIRRDLERIGVHGWSGPLGYFLLGEADVARYASGAPLNTDDRLTLEFSAARALYLETARASAQQVRKFRTADLPEVTASSRAELEQPDARRWIGMVLLGRGATGDAAGFLPRGTAIGTAAPPPQPAPAR